MGFTLEERGKYVSAFHAATAVQIFGVSGKDAITQMTNFLNIHNKDPDIRFTFERNDERTGYLRRVNSDERTVDIGTPTELFRAWGNKELQWSTQEKIDAAVKLGLEAAQPFLDAHAKETVDNIEDTFEDTEKAEVDPTPVIARNANGVPLDGATAYAEGIMAADNPYEEGTDEADQWDSQWDQAADEAPEDEGGDKGGTVVASKYRQKYAELGHPTHCGDWLAQLLNNYCIGDKNTDLEVFERICSLNGVDTSKYKRHGTGWQGRIRMTGRNLLAKKVFAAKKIVVPAVGEGADDANEHHEIKAPADWLAAQRYSKPAEAA